MSAEQNIDLLTLELLNGAGFINPGIFIEVGAARPDYLSISENFRKLNWKVVGIEPNPYFYAMHKDMGYIVHQYACSDTNADAQDFFVVDSKGVPYLDGNVSYESFSSLGVQGDYLKLFETVSDSRSLSKIKVDVRTLDAILAKHHPDVTALDVVAIDVEGWELNVMRGLSTHKFKPKIVILENLFNKEEYRKYMHDIGFTLIAKLDPNELYARSDIEWRISYQRNI